MSAVLWALASSGLGAGDDDLVVACMSRAASNLRWGVCVADALSKPAAVSLY